MRIKVLTDNTSDYSLFKSEWGLSVLFEYNNEKILLDFGQSNKFISNAYHLDTNLDNVDYAVLSHAHYDHGNGMNYFFKENDYAKLYLSSNARDLCYRDMKVLGINNFKVKKYIGIHKGFLSKYSNRLEYLDKKTEITKGVYVIPYSNKVNLNFDSNLMTKNMYVRKYNSDTNSYDKNYITDTFNHEVILLFDTTDGLVIANSCSHLGVKNIIGEVRKIFPKKHIYAYIGGLHLFKAKEDTIRELGKVFLEEDIDYVITGHCTGDRAYKILDSMLGERMRHTESGYEIEI